MVGEYCNFRVRAKESPIRSAQHSDLRSPQKVGALLVSGLTAGWGFLVLWELPMGNRDTSTTENRNAEEAAEASRDVASLCNRAGLDSSKYRLFTSRSHSSTSPPDADESTPASAEDADATPPLRTSAAVVGARAPYQVEYFITFAGIPGGAGTRSHAGRRRHF